MKTRHLLLAAAALCAACGDGPAAPSPEVRPIPIERVDVLTLESFPPQYMVHIEGYLPDSCWSFDAIQYRRDQRAFIVEVTMRRNAPAGAVCLQRIEIVERNVNLGALEPGDYVVYVNGTVQRPFRAS